MPIIKNKALYKPNTISVFENKQPVFGVMPVVLTFY